MIGYPEGIALGSLFFAGSQIAVVAIKQKYLNSENSGNFVSEKLCSVKHESVERELTGINKKLDIILDSMTRKG